MPHTPTDPDGAQRARIVIIALAVLVAMIAGTAVIAALIDDTPTESSTAIEGEDALSSPAIIPQPNSGEEPEEAGDRGGWAQLTLLGLLVVTLVGIGFVVARGSRRSRANRAEWLAAATADEDGVIDDRRT